MTQTSDNLPKIFAVVLAAGEGNRFGSTKQLLQVNASGDGETMVSRAARLAAECCGEYSLLVVGHDSNHVAASAAPHCRFIAVNDRYADGLGTTIARATLSLAHVADAMLLMLADQPKITAKHLRELTAAWTAKSRHIVVTAFGDSVGPPAILPRGTFGALRKLAGNQGAKVLFGDPTFLVTTVRLQDAAVDIDTPGDLEAID